MTREKTHSNRKEVFKGILASIGLIILLALLFDFIVMPLYTFHGAERELPDVTEMELDEAVHLLRAKGFTVTREPDKFDPHIPTGTVIFQNPRPFTVVKKGRRVSLTISAGIRLVEVPSLIGLSERDAVTMLQKSGLICGEIFYRIDNFYPRGVVCDQDTIAEAQIPENSIVNFTLSIGSRPDHFVVPDVCMKGLDEAKKLIGRSGLHVGEVTFQVDTNLIPETVIKQSVPAGDELSQGDKIDLIVSKLEDQWIE